MENAFIVLLGFTAFCAVIVGGFIVAALFTPPIKYAGRRPNLIRRIIDKLDTL